MAALTATLGATLVLATGVDLMLTVLHPTREGPLSRLAIRATWGTVRRAAVSTRIGRLMNYAGPLAMACQFATWVLGMWVGFALVYSGHVDSLSFASGTEFGTRDLLDALYLSAVALTTVGFGDVVAATDGLRLVTVLEAASGLAVITGAITYLLSVYPLVSQVRVAARSVAPAAPGDQAAHEFVTGGGHSELAALRRDLIQIDEDTQRFPVLYYFHSEDPSASLQTLIRASSLVTMQLRWGARRGGFEIEWYGAALESALASLIESYRDSFMRGAAVPEAHEWAGERTLARLERLRASAGEPPSSELEADEMAAFAMFLKRSERFLADLAERHAYRYEPL